MKRTINREKCKAALPSVLLLAFMFVTGIYFYYNDIEHVAKGRNGNYVLNDINPEETAVLSEKELVQDYTTTRDHVSRIGLGFRKTGEVKDLELHVELREKASKTLVQRWDVRAEDLTANGDFDYFLMPDMLVGKGRSLEIALSADGAEEDGLLEVYYSRNRKNYGNLKVNGNGSEKNLALTVSGPVQYIGKLFILMTAGFLVLTGVVLYLFDKKKNVKTEQLFLITASFLGLVYLMVFTPYSEPDGTAHIATSFYYADVLTGKRPADDTGHVLVRKDDAEADGFSDFMGLDNYNTEKERLFAKAENTEMTAYARGKLKVPITAHLPQTLGTTLGILLGASAAATLYLGKLFSFLFYLLCCYFAIKLMPFGKMILFYTALLPFSLEMATSYSYDGTVLALAFLMTGYAFYLKCDKKKVTVKDMVLWLVLTMWLSPCKIVYFFISFLIVLVPKEKFKKNLYYYGAAAATAGGACLSLLLSRLTTISDTVTGEMGDYFTIPMFFENPSESFLMIGRTIEAFTDEYLRQMFGGVFSWFDVTISWTTVILYIILFCGVLLCVQRENVSVDNKDKMWIGGICLLIIAAVAASMLFTWSPKDTNKIIGIQGRYFLPILPLIGILFRNKLIVLQRSIDKELVTGMIFMQFFTIMQIFTTVVWR